MTADVLQACLQAYTFAELVLGGFLAKTAKAQNEAVEAAEILRDEVEAHHQQVLSSDTYPESQVAALSRVKARLDERITEARLLILGTAGA